MMTILKIFTVLSLLVSANSFARTVAPGTGKIILRLQKGHKIPKDKAERKIYIKSYLAACKNLGEAMIVGKGPWGFGVLKDYSCYLGKKRIFGPKKNRPEWDFHIIDTKKESSVLVYRSEFRKGPISKIVLPPSDFTMKFYEDAEYVDLMAYTIMESMPVAMYLDRKLAVNSKIDLKVRYPRAGRSSRFKYDSTAAPEEITAYTVKFNRKIRAYDADYIGSGTAGERVPPRKVSVGEEQHLKGGTVEYSINLEKNAGNEPQWAHNSDGPGAKNEELIASLKEANLRLNSAANKGELDNFLKGKFQSIASMLLDTLAGGYVGLRYGLQVIPGESMQSETSIFSLLAEVRGGALEGLRYYYDTVPEIKRNVQVATDDPSVTIEKETSIKSSRHVLGFSWGLEIDSFVDRITVDPKLGIWTYSAKLASLGQDKKTIVSVNDFEVGTTFSMALEVGAEWPSDWYTIRTWYAIDTGVSLLKTGGKITSNKFGFDGFFTAGPKFSLFGLPVKTALLGFYFFESVAISNGEQKRSEDLEAGEFDIHKIEYQAGYAGMGVLVQW